MKIGKDLEGKPAAWHILGQINLFYIMPSNFFKIHINIIFQICLDLANFLFPSDFTTKVPVSIGKRTKMLAKINIDQFDVSVSVHRKSILYKEPIRCNFGSIVY